ncbi:DUF1570 domain-containing protein [Planctomycetota bacterium]
MSPNMVVCEGCQARLNVSKVPTGKKIRCPKCKHTLVVPPVGQEAPAGSDKASERKTARRGQGGPAAKKGSSARKAPSRQAETDTSAPELEEESEEQPVRGRRSAGVKPRQTRGGRAADHKEDLLQNRRRERIHSEPSKYRIPIMIGVVVAVICVCIGVFSQLMQEPPPAPDNGGGGAAIENEQDSDDPKEKFLKNYRNRLERAGFDVHALYELATEAKEAGLSGIHEKLLKKIQAMDDNLQNDFTRTVIMPELGFEFLKYHYLDQEESSEYEKVWLEKEEWLKQENLDECKKSEVEYQEYINDPRTKKKQEILAQVSRATNMEPDKFAIALTDHYAILIEKSRRYVLKDAFDQYTTILEQLYTSFTEFFEPYKDIVKLREASPDETILFTLFVDKASYTEHCGAPDDSAGVYQLGSKMMFSFKTANNTLISTIFHEGAHQLVDFYSVTWKNPILHSFIYPWYNEGMAEYFSGLGRDGDKFLLCQFREDSTAGIYRAIKIDRAHEEYTIENIIAISQSTLMGDLPRYSTKIYAGGWSLVYFFLHAEDGKYTKDFMRFVNSSMHGNGTPEKFREIFSKYDMKQLNKSWRNYVRKVLFKMVK